MRGRWSELDIELKLLAGSDDWSALTNNFTFQKEEKEAETRKEDVKKAEEEVKKEEHVEVEYDWKAVSGRGVR